jgi:hypothetical protein
MRRAGGTAAEGEGKETKGWREGETDGSKARATARGRVPPGRCDRRQLWWRQYAFLRAALFFFSFFFHSVFRF